MQDLEALRNPLYLKGITMKDLKPGRRISLICPHLSPKPDHYTIASVPYTKLEHEGGDLEGVLWVELIWEEGDIACVHSLADLGIIPYPSGRWSTNFSVWRSHAGFAGRQVCDSAAFHEARARRSGLGK